MRNASKILRALSKCHMSYETMNSGNIKSCSMDFNVSIDGKNTAMSLTVAQSLDAPKMGESFEAYDIDKEVSFLIHSTPARYSCVEYSFDDFFTTHKFLKEDEGKAMSIIRELLSNTSFTDADLKSATARRHDALEEFNMDFCLT